MLSLKKIFFSININYKNKLRSIQYLNRSIVFVIDLFLSSFGTLCALQLVWFILGKNGIMTYWEFMMALTAIISIILFFLFRVYKTSIRFSRLRELNRIFFLLIVKCSLLSLIVIKQEFLSVKYSLICCILDLFISSFFIVILSQISL